MPAPRFVTLNGSPGVITAYADGSVSAITFAFEGQRVKAIYIVRNPDKLAGLRL